MTLERLNGLAVRAGRICPLCKEDRPGSCKCDSKENIARIVAEDRARWHTFTGGAQ